MDHRDIEARDVVGRYLRRELGSEEEEQFEMHLLLCAQCQDEVEADARLGLALASVSREDEAPRATASVPTTRRVSPRTLAWAASILVALLPAWFFYRQGEALESRLAVQQEQAETRIRALEEQVGDGGRSGDAPSDAERIRRLEAELEAALRPRTDVPMIYLAPVRDTRPEEEAPLRLTLSDEPEWVVLAAETAGRSELYDLELLAPDGSILLRAESLAPDGYGRLNLTVYSPDLVDGTHLLRIFPRNGEEPRDTRFTVRR